MKNIYEVMRHKEAQIERLKIELQALHVVAPLLQEDLPEEEVQVAAPAVQPHRSPQSAVVAATPDSKPAWP